MSQWVLDDGRQQVCEHNEGGEHNEGCEHNEGGTDVHQALVRW
jgi:hypothetical protein